MSDTFLKIKQKYIGTFDLKVKDLSDAMENKDVLHIHDLLHKLSGSSGGYGLHDLCVLAQKGMHLSQDENKTDFSALQACVSEITALLAQYKQNTATI